MPPQEGCAIYKRPPDKRSTVFFLCRKRHGYTRDFLDWPTNRNLLGFQCRKRQCYTRDSIILSVLAAAGGFNAASGNAIRATLSLAARVITGLRQRFSQPSRFFLEMGAFFVDTVFSKSPKTSCHPLISKGSSCPRFFVATSPVFRGKNEKIFLLPVYHFPVAACNSFCKFSRAFIVY